MQTITKQTQIKTIVSCRTSDDGWISRELAPRLPPFLRENHGTHPPGQTATPFQACPSWLHRCLDAIQNFTVKDSKRRLVGDLELKPNHESLWILYNWNPGRWQDENLDTLNTHSSWSLLDPPKKKLVQFTNQSWDNLALAHAELVALGFAGFWNSRMFRCGHIKPIRIL